MQNRDFSDDSKKSFVFYLDNKEVLPTLTEAAAYAESIGGILKARTPLPAPPEKAVPESPMADAYRSLVYNLVE